MAMNKVDYKYFPEDPPNAILWEYKKKYRDKTPVLNEEAQFYNYKMVERRERQFE